MGIFEKMKGKIAKAALVLTAVVCCALSFGSVANAYQYYDGGDLNFSTPGANSNGVPSSGTTTQTGDYQVRVIVRRSPTLRTGTTVIPTDYVANYGSKKTGWMYRDVNGMGVNYNENSSICNSIPPTWSTENEKLHLGSNGVVYYTCSTDGYPSAYIVDFTQYGYYDKDGKVQYTGYSGYLYCPKCSDISYELYLDEEYQGVGILQGMDDAGFSDDLASDLTFRINRELSIPSFVFREHRHTESWFTEEGAKRFEKDIQAILKEYEYDGLFEVRKRIVDKLEDVVYEDENQVVVDTKKQYQKRQENEQKNNANKK